MAIDPKGFLGQCVLGNVVEMMEGRLRSPADIERRLDIGLSPVINFLQLVPIGHVFELKQLDGRTRDDQTVEFFLSHLFPVPIESDHVIVGRVFRGVLGDLDQAQLHLQRRCADETGKLRFGPDLVRHQVEKPDAERPNILAVGGIFRHQHDTLFLKGEARGQIIWNFYGHGNQRLSIMVPSKFRKSSSDFIFGISSM